MILRELIDALTLIPDKYHHIEVVFFDKNAPGCMDGDKGFRPFNEISIIDNYTVSGYSHEFGPVVAFSLNMRRFVERFEIKNPFEED